MRKALITGLAMVFLAAMPMVTGTAGQQLKTHQYRCTDRNTSLYIVIYERGGKIEDGTLYLENIQVGNLTAHQLNPVTIRAKVNGNAANVELGLNKDRKTIFVHNLTTNTVTEICKCSYAYR